MKIINNIVYADRAMTEIVKAKYVGNYTIRAQYNSGEIVDVDFSTIKAPAFKPLQDKKILQAFALNYGCIEWLGGKLDISPEYMLRVGKRVARF